MNITSQDILDLLPIVQDRGWTIEHDLIRDRDNRCPVCALVHELSGGEIRYTYDAGMAVAELLGVFDWPTVYSIAVSICPIVSAADSSEAAGRPQLLEALGLTESH
jgi:hypothetical protein